MKKILLLVVIIGLAISFQIGAFADDDDEDDYGCYHFAWMFDASSRIVAVFTTNCNAETYLFVDDLQLLLTPVDGSDGVFIAELPNEMDGSYEIRVVDRDGIHSDDGDFDDDEDDRSLPCGVLSIPPQGYTSSYCGTFAEKPTAFGSSEFAVYDITISGDIKAPRILIADGASFKGNVDMDI